MGEVDAAAWDRLAGDNPFVSHAFLAALERYGCVSPEQGWQPMHLVVQDRHGQLLGAAPLYLKGHSWGEFVFDFSWARASGQLGQPYYPKLLCAVPFVPSSGPRLLATDAGMRARLAGAISRLADEHQLSSAHALFVDAHAGGAFAGAGWLAREDLQFHWFNAGYPDFAAFVATLSSDKRKKLLRERRRVQEAGIHFEHRPGESLTVPDWHQIYTLYANTYEERGQTPYLTPEFLIDYGGRAGSPLRLIMGYQNGHLVCMALTVAGGDTLYGRHWGAAEHYHSLHFECCYHQGIELCITAGLARYDAGTQGEHKLSRGFLPVATHSHHYLRHPRLRSAVEDYLQEERREVAARRLALGSHAPYRQDGGAKGAEASRA